MWMRMCAGLGEIFIRYNMWKRHEKADEECGMSAPCASGRWYIACGLGVAAWPLAPCGRCGRGVGFLSI